MIARAHGRSKAKKNPMTLSDLGLKFRGVLLLVLLFFGRLTPASLGAFSLMDHSTLPSCEVGLPAVDVEPTPGAPRSNGP